MVDKQEPGLGERITAYLATGGLFNPELARHDTVRDLLIDCRAALAHTGKVGVKPLEWREYKALGNAIKTIANDCFGNEFRRYDKRLSEIPQSDIDAAQADYEARILSAIQTGGDND